MAGRVHLRHWPEFQTRRIVLIQSSATVVHLQMSGEFDISNKASLSALLLPAESADYVIIDMTDTTYIDSSALHCLTHLKKQLMSRTGGAIHLTGVHPSLRRIFTITGLDALFEISSQYEES